MRWDRRGFLGASIVTAAAAYPYGKLLAARPSQTADLTVNFEDAGGSTLNSGATNNKAYTRAVNYLSRRGGGTLVVPPKVYPFSGASICTAANVTVSAGGATFAGNNLCMVIASGSTGYNLQGLTLLETSGASGTFLMDCYGTGCHFSDLHLEKNPPSKGYIAFCREMTSGNVFENVSFAGSNGIFLGGHDHQIIGGWAESSFGDDCWAIKSTASPCYNIQISGFQARRFGAIVSIGSEIGTAGSDDPNHSLFVKNVAIDNCSADECTYLAYIKPGGIQSIDYRDGVVENVSITNCQLTDSTGQRFRDGVFISPARGAIVRGINIQNVTITARGASPAVQSVAGLYLCPIKFTDGAGAGGSIDDVYVSGLHCVDPYGGAATSVSTPGTPINSLVAIEKMNPSIGNVGRVDINDSGIDGCARMAVWLGSNIEGPVSFNNCTFDNYAAAIYSYLDKGSVLARSPVSLSGIAAKPSPSAPSDTRGVMPDGTPDKTIAYLGDVSTVSLPTVPAATAATSPIYTSSRDTWVSKVEVAVAQPIPASATNFVRFTLRNAATGAALASASTSTGALGQAGISMSINGDVQLSGAAACIPKGAQLLVEISQGGSGTAVVDPTFTVHCVPFGSS
jgi:hypothetical protein